MPKQTVRKKTLNESIANTVIRDKNSLKINPRKGLKSTPRKMEFMKAERPTVSPSSRPKMEHNPLDFPKGILLGDDTEIKNTPSPLSKEFQVAVVIFDYNKKNRPIGSNQLVEELNGIVSRNTIRKSLDILIDWKIISFNFGEAETHRASKLFFINPELEPLVEELWKNFWYNTKD